MRFVYPAQLKRAAPDEIVVSFRDLPECLTSGDDREDALREARDALEEAIAGRIDDGEPIPLPSGCLPGEDRIPLSDEMTAIANLYLVCRQSNFSPAALDAILGVKSEAVGRMLNPQLQIGVSCIAEMHSVIQSEHGVEIWEPPIAGRITV